MPFDVMVLTECWIQEDSIIPQINGYSAYRTHRFINRAGGVVVYVNRNLPTAGV